jgi:polyisoprenoid-binding protein YceI
MSNTKWTLDPTHSEIQFKIKHLMITNVTGSFNNFEVNAESVDDKFSEAKISFNADVNSISTNNEQRDGHLKSADFFDADNYPKISFEASNSANVSGEDFELVGDLTIKDVTKSVKLNVEFGGVTKDPYGNTKAGFTINGKINRKDFGLTWNAPLEAGGVMVSEDVKILGEIQLVKQA